MQPQILFRQPNELSEGPLWDDRTNTLYWLDILSGSIFRSQAPHSEAEPERWSPSVRVACLGLAEDGSLVGALEEGVARLVWGQPPQMLCTPTFDRTTVCYNDGKVGPDGAFWVGAKDRAHKTGIAPLERVTAESQAIMADDLIISNGLGWSPDGQFFYLTDSPRRVIWRYRWNEKGVLGKREVFLDGTEAPGVPDGLTVDSEGCLWIARWGGSQIVRVSPRGEVLTRVAFPVSRVSSCTLGGPHMKTLFVTTAREDLDDDERRAEVLAGSVFAIEVDVPGLPSFRFPTR